MRVRSGSGSARRPTQKDALLDRGDKAFDVILTNPPFGKRQSFRTVREDDGIDSERQDYVRDGFTVTTGNKQLNFLQHIMSILKVGGRAAGVMPDNVPFEGGAGETLRRRLLEEFGFHTLLRLPTGIFYSQGEGERPVLRPRHPRHRRRDARPVGLRPAHQSAVHPPRMPAEARGFRRFVACYGSKYGRRDRTETERLKRYSYDELAERDKLNRDLFWLKDADATDPDSLEKFRLVASRLAAG